MSLPWNRSNDVLQPADRVNFHRLKEQVRGWQRERTHRLATEAELLEVEVVKGTPFNSGRRHVRHDSVYLKGTKIGTLQYSTIEESGLRSDATPELTISALGGTRRGMDLQWLIRKAKGALLFVSQEELDEAYGFNEQRLGAPRS